jgi:stringent starvation protein B
MAKERSNRPYLIRAIYEWCSDSGLTPYLSVKVNEQTRVPTEFVKDGEIVLNIGPDATRRLTIGNDTVQFSARFGGVSRECSIPMGAVKGIFARENNQGLFFPSEDPAPQHETTEPVRDEPPSPPASRKPKLQIIK